MVENLILTSYFSFFFEEIRLPINVQTTYRPVIFLVIVLARLQYNPWTFHYWKAKIPDGALTVREIENTVRKI